MVRDITRISCAHCYPYTTDPLRFGTMAPKPISITRADHPPHPYVITILVRSTTSYPSNIPNHILAILMTGWSRKSEIM